MREILFRGKRVYNNEWVYGMPCCDSSELRGVDSVQSFDGGIYYIIPETLGQYTGVIDKNGKKIFEGDVVKYDGTCGKIVFSEYHGAFMSKEKDIYYEWLSRIPRRGTGIMEIIGNIYDNKEILESKE